MAVESELLTFALNNGVGVLFGLLIWWQSVTTQKANTKALEDLKDTLEKLAAFIGSCPHNKLNYEAK
jgi:hypothetical protein